MDKAIESIYEHLEKSAGELEDFNKVISDIFGYKLVVDEEKISELEKEAENFLEMIKNKELPEDLSDDFLNPYSFNWYTYGYREEAIRHMGFALITKRFARNLANYINGEKCLEIMAGKGTLSKALLDEGVDIKVTDNFSWKHRLNMDDTWTQVENIDCLDAIRKYGKDVSYIICSWIPYEDSIGYEALKLMNEVNPNCKMIVIGEGKGGCTADDKFFDHCDYVDLGKDGYSCEAPIEGFKSWDGIHDYVSIIKYREEGII